MDEEEGIDENVLVEDEREVKDLLEHKTIRFSVDDNKLEEESTPSINSFGGSERYNFLTKWRSSREARSDFISLMSAVYAVLLVIFALAIEIAVVVSGEVEGHAEYDAFYIYVYAVGLLFFLFCFAFLLRTYSCNRKHIVQKVTRHDILFQPSPNESKMTNHSSTISQRKLSMTRKVTHSAQNAGSLYLRLGAVSFGVVAMIERGLLLFRWYDRSKDFSCQPLTKLIENIFAIMFIFIQMYFIFKNAKMIIHRFKDIGRIGMMHLIAANLCMWIRSLVVEEYTVIQEIGENTDHHGSHGTKIITHVLNHSLLANNGNATNITLNADKCSSWQPTLDKAFHEAKPFMVSCTIEYSVICAAVTYILWRNIGEEPIRLLKFRKQNFRVDCSSSMKGMFAGLLFLVFTVVTMVIYFAKISDHQDAEALRTFYFTDILIYCVSIAATIFGAIRMSSLLYVTTAHNAILLDDILLIVGFIGQLMYCVFSIIALNQQYKRVSLVVVVSILRMVQVLVQTVFVLVAQRLVALTPSLQSRKPGREVVTFLLMVNLAMFLINTFETQKAAANPLTTEFYGRNVWTVIVYSTVPLSSFYRFHSSVCLAEIWKQAFRVKNMATN